MLFAGIGTIPPTQALATTIGCDGKIDRKLQVEPHSETGHRANARFACNRGMMKRAAAADAIDAAIPGYPGSGVADAHRAAESMNRQPMI